MNSVLSSCKKILCILLVLFLGYSLMAQSYNTPSSGSTSITTCSGTLYDPGGTGTYPNYCGGYIIIYPQATGCKVHLEGNYNTESSYYDPITIYDGAGTYGNQLECVGGTGYLSVTSTSGPLTVYFSSDGSVTYSGYEFTISCIGGCNCGGAPFGLTTSLATQSVNLSWVAGEGVTSYIIEYGYAGFTLGTGTRTTANTNSCTISNLTEGADYDFYVYYDCGNDGVITNELPGMISAHVPYGEVHTVPSSGSMTATTCGATILDPNGYSEYYSPNYSGYLVVQPNSTGCVVEIEGEYNIDYWDSDNLIIYDGAGTNGTILFNSNDGIDYGYGHLHAISTSGPLTVYFYSSSYSYAEYGGYNGFELEAHCVGGCSCGGSPYGVVANATNSGIEISWAASIDPNQQYYFIEYGPEGFTPGTGTLVRVNGTSYEFTGLTTYATYDFYIYFDCGNDGVLTDENPARLNFCVPEATTCVDFTNLNSSNIICTYGDFSNPYASLGAVDYGEMDMSSRHTIHRIQATDPRTDNRLQVIPPCELYSVRLGNWNTGAEAESISYDFAVDTAVADILLLKYAAVLEDPGHDPSEQPRFTFDILNQNGAVIDPICGSADFIANASLGWNTSMNGQVLWKDWTNVGIDVSRYHGQTIRVRMTTYDCEQWGHYGYAYFTLNCKKKTILAETCGEMLTNTYTAPAGFAYRWYYQNSPNVTISTSQSVSVSFVGGEENLCCWCSFVGNSNCGFELMTSLASRYPLAAFSAERDSCSYVYSFRNESTISSDGVNPNGSGDPCEGAYWDFGDGATSTEMNPSHDFERPGIYSIQLISTISQDECQDTANLTIEIPNNAPYIDGDFEICNGETTTLTAAGGTGYTWLCGGQTISTDAAITISPTTTTTYTLQSTAPDGCSVELEQPVVVHDSAEVFFKDTICQGEHYSGHGFSVSAQAFAGTVNQTHYYQNRFGCDSTIHLELLVRPLPNTSLGSNRVHCFEDDGNIVLTVPTDNCDSYLWSTNETTRSISVSCDGTYSVHAVLDGCSSDGQVTITDKCPFNIYLPNCITPTDYNSVNDYFYLPTTKDIDEFQICIFDRWGRMVYTSTDPHFQWDGSVNGKIRVNNVYTYRIDIKTTSNEKLLLKGTITVL